MRTYKDAKTMAKSLRTSLAGKDMALSHSECLEIVAKQFGFADWNTFSAMAAPEQLSCSFCGKAQQRLIEGGCSRRGGSPYVFICDECVWFCAQVNADAS